MANIKIDEIEFFTLLNSVTIYIEESVAYAPKKTKESGVELLKLIDRYQDIAKLKIQRKMYYDFYITNRMDNPIEANKAYQNYLQVKEKLNHKM